VANFNQNPEAQLGAKLDGKVNQDTRTIAKALHKAALLGEAVVAEATPVDRGRTRNGWYVQRTHRGAIVANDSPIAGILELGSRPHWPPLMPILRWVVRKFGLDLAGGRRSLPEEGLDEVPWPTYHAAKTVQEGIAKEGTEAHRMVGDNLQKLTKLAKAETERALRQTKSFDPDDVPF